VLRTCGFQVFLAAMTGSAARGQRIAGRRQGRTSSGLCDVFEVRDGLIQRCFIYLDPDYAGADTDRYPWLAAPG